MAFEGDAAAYTDLMAAFGTGSIAAAFVVPRLLHHFSERRLMLAGAASMGGMAFTILSELDFAGLLALWTGLGAASSLVLPPGSLLLVRSSGRAERPALFAA